MHLKFLLKLGLQFAACGIIFVGSLITIKSKHPVIAAGQSSSPSPSTAPVTAHVASVSHALTKVQAPKMPVCPKKCTWNKGAQSVNQCWTYMVTGATQGQVVGYSTQQVNGSDCAWTYYLAGDYPKGFPK